MATRPKASERQRLTTNRVAELHERIGRLEARIEDVIDQLDRRDTTGVLLAEALGQASLHVLRRAEQKPIPRQEGHRRR